MRRIWDGTKTVCRFIDRLFIWYLRFCLVVWIVMLGCMWVRTSYHAGHVAGFSEMKTAFDAWGNDRADSAEVGR